MKRLFFSFSLCLIYVIEFAATQCQGQTANWPGFRGAALVGVAENQKPPVHFGPSSNLLWRIEVPKGLSSPIVWKDSIFATGSDGNRLITFCLDRREGKRLWEQAIIVEKLEKVHGANSVATPTPVTDGRAVYAYFGSFGMVAYDLQGKELWRKPLPIPQTFMNQGTGTSPILAEDKLLVFLQIGTNSHLLALRPKDGQEMWQAPMPDLNMTYATPVYWKENGGGFAGLMCVSRFTAFRLADGKEAWWVGGLSLETCSTPVVAGDRLIISAAGIQGERANMTLPPPFDEAVQKFDRNGDAMISYDEIPSDLLFTDRQAANGQGNVSLRLALTLFAEMKKDEKLNQARWEELRKTLREFIEDEANQTVVASVRTGGSGDVTKSHVTWKESKGAPEVPSPLVYQGRVYLIRSDGILCCRDLETGKLIYEKATDSRGGYFASPVAADGRIYIASDRGAITVIKSGDAFEVLARNDLNDRIMASPALAENTLYVRSAKSIWGFAARRD
jgi:outer membrane protein assembly factor BamB